MTRRLALLEHPWAEIRKSKGMSQASLAASLDVSKEHVGRVEQGVFRKAPAEIITYLSVTFNINYTYLEESYYEYQLNTRKLFAEKYQSYMDVRPTDWSNPIEAYYKSQGLSRVGLCKGWCVHPASLADYQKNRQRNAPADVKRAFKVMSGINNGWDIEQLEIDMDKWRKRPNG